MPQAIRPSNQRGPAFGGTPLARVPVADLKLGMFVADLDRPWSDTPFLLEGLLLESERELALITGLCSEVTVDLSRSVGLEDAPPPAEPALSSAARWENESAWMELSDDRLCRAVAQTVPESAGQGTAGSTEPSVDCPPLHRRPIAWFVTVCRQLLESYLRPGPRSLDDLPQGDRAAPSFPRPAAGGRPGTPSLIVRILRELTRPGRRRGPDPLPATPSLEGRPDTPDAPDSRSGSWAGLRRALGEIFSRRHRGAPAASDASAPGTPAPLPLPSAANAPEYDGAPRSLPFRVLLWRVVLKLLGLGRRHEKGGTAPWSQPTAAGTTDGGELTAAERADAEQQVKRFEQDLPRVAATLRQCIRTMHAAYHRAARGLPLSIETLDPVVTQIVDDVLQNQDATLWLSRLQSHDQTAHARGMQAAVYMAHLGSHLGLPREELERLALAGALLDIGKMRVPAAILRKPGALDEGEMQQARSHVELALQLLDASGRVDGRVRQAIERHHEREDGSGYPGRMVGDAIGLYGRMAGIVDTFLALSGVRPYAPPQPMDDCLRVLLKGRGTLFHAPLVEHFIQMIGLYPVGSLVELSTGEVAAVLSHNRVRRLRPRVLLMVGADGVPMARPSPLDLLYRPRDAAGEEIRIVRGLPVGSHGIKASDLFAATVP